MAGNKIQVKGSSSKIKVKNNKIVIAGGTDVCCCGAPGASCANCDDPAPAKILAVFSGISPCITVGSCEAVDTNSHSYKITTFNVNGSYCLTQCGSSPGTCYWQGIFTGKFAATFYDDNACSVFHCSSDTIAITVQKGTSDTWSVIVAPAVPLSSDPCNGYDIGCFDPYDIFRANSDAITANDCATGYTFSNGQNSGGHTSAECFQDRFGLLHTVRNVAYGGSCTITPFGC